MLPLSKTEENNPLLNQAYKQIDVILKLNKLLDEKLFELTVINEIGSIIRSVEDYEGVMKSILTILNTILKYDIGGIVLQEDQNLDVYVNITKKIYVSEFSEFRNRFIDTVKWHTIPTSSLTVNKEVITGQDYIYKSKLNPRSISFYSIPLEIRSKIIGSFFIANLGREITEHNKYTLNMVVNQAILVINNCQLYHKMKDMAIHDGLTNLYNHRYFQSSLEKEIQRIGRHKESLYLMLLDIDYFKDYNDRYGHQKGDILLQMISKVLLINVREVDLVARYGGEEFVIILPYTDKKGALKVAERIRSAVEAFPFHGKNENEIVHKTVSIGLSSYANKKSKVDLISLADTALYQAKHGGRNIIKIAEE